MRTILGIGMLAALALAGCGNQAVGSSDPDGPPPVPADAGPAGSPAAPAVPPTSEMVSGGARLTGGSLQLDVQIGHGLSQEKVTGGSKSLEGAAAVKR